MLCARTGSSWFFPLVENLNRLLRSGSGSRPLARPLQASPRVVGLLLRTGCALLINISAVPTRLPIPTWGNRVPPAFCSRCWHLHPLLSSRFTPCHQRPGVQLVKELGFSSITWPVANTAEHCSCTPSRFGSASPRIAWAGWLRVVSRWVEY